jgi:ketosteroid isomerase-like protein
VAGVFHCGGKGVSKQPIEVVQEVYQAFGRGDVATILGLVSEGAGWDFPGPEEYPVFGRRRGRDGALAFFQAVGANEDVSEFVIDRLLPSGDVVTALGHLTLTLKRNGAKVAYDWVHVWDVAAGEVVAFKGLVDTAAVLDAYRR